MTPDNGQVQIQFSEKVGKALLETPREGMQNKTRRDRGSEGERSWRERFGRVRMKDEAGREMEWSAESSECVSRGEKVGQGGGVQRVGMLKSPIQLYKLFHQPLASSLFLPYTPLFLPASSSSSLTVNDCPLLEPQRWSVITKGSFLLWDNLHIGECFHYIVYSMKNVCALWELQLLVFC